MGKLELTRYLPFPATSSAVLATSLPRHHRCSALVVVEREASRQPAAGAEGVDVAVACHGSMTGFGALELLARAGFLMKGVVYIVVGALALQVRSTRIGARICDVEAFLSACYSILNRLASYDLDLGPAFTRAQADVNRLVAAVPGMIVALVPAPSARIRRHRLQRRHRPCSRSHSGASAGQGGSAR